MESVGEALAKVFFGGLHEVDMAVSVEHIEAVGVISSDVCGAIGRLSDVVSFTDRFVSANHSVAASVGGAGAALKVGVTELAVLKDVRVSASNAWVLIVARRIRRTPLELLGVVADGVAHFNVEVFGRGADIGFGVINVFIVDQCAEDFGDVGGVVGGFVSFHMGEEAIFSGVLNEAEANASEVVCASFLAGFLLGVE